MVDLSTAQAAVKASQDSPTELQLLMEACMQSTQYLLQEYNSEVHWFCDDTLRPVAAKSIMAISYDRAMEEYLRRLNPVLTRCANCARIYHIEFTLLKTQLLNTDCSLDVVEPFFQNVKQLNADRLNKQIQQMYDKLHDNPQAGIKDVKDYIVPLYECLCCDILSDEKYDDLYNNFRYVMLRLSKNTSEAGESPDQNGQNVLSVNEVLPGLVILLFGRDGELHRWAKQALQDVDSKTQELDPVTIDTFCNAIVASAESNKKKEYKDRRLFWFNASIMFQHLDRAAVLQLAKQDDHSISKFLANEILLVPSTSIRSVLRALHIMIQKLGKFFWRTVSANPRSVAVAILENDYLVQDLSAQQRDPQTPMAEYDIEYLSLDVGNLFSWVDPFMDSCEGSMVFSAGELISRALFKIASRAPDEQIAIDILSKALSVLESSFAFQITDGNNGSSDKLMPLLPPADRLARADLKQMMGTSASSILHCLTIPKLLDQTLRIVSLSIQFDVASGFLDAPLRNVQQGRDTTVKAELSREYSTSLWDCLNKNPLKFFKNSSANDDDIAITATILKASKYSAFIPHAPTKKVDNFWPKDHLSKQVIKSVQDALRIISDLDSKKLQHLLRDEENLTCLLMNMYSVDWSQNEATVDTLCQAYETDTVNRFDAILSMLQSNLRGSLTAICNGIDLVRHMEMMSPCSQLIKVLQDVITCLFGASGVLDNQKNQFSSGNSNELLRFWNSSWALLKLAFERIYPLWVGIYKSDTMIEFMRDMLDCCKGLLDAFRLVETDLSKIGDENKNFGEMLVTPAINSVKPLCTLLRLKDETLIHSSYENIMKIIELMKSYKVSFPSPFVDELKKLATRQTSNVVPDTKLTVMLASTGQFSNDEISDLVRRDRATANKAATGTTQKLVGVSKAAPGAASRFPSAGLGSGPHKSNPQRTLNDFLQIRSGPPEPPAARPEPVSKSSNMDAIREMVRSQRNTSTEAGRKKEIKEIHPARPAGFHSKRAQEISARREAAASKSKKHGDSSSDDSDNNEDDDGLESLFTPKSTLSSLQNMQRHSTSTISGVGVRKPANTAAMRELEERNMRRRLNIDLDPLYEKVLSWDYHNDSEYPNSNRNYISVGSNFQSVEQYQNTFEPLLLLECWQSISRAKEELAGAETPFQIVTGNRVTCDRFIEVYATMESAIASKVRLSDSDIVVLTYYDTNEPTALRPDSKRPYCLAKVKEVKNGSSAAQSDIKLRTFEPGDILPFLGSRTILHVQKVIRYVILKP